MFATASTFEIAFRLPGRSWRRKTFRNEIAAEKYVEKLPCDAEIRWSF